MHVLYKYNNQTVSIIIKRNKWDESLEPGTGMGGLYKRVINYQ